MSIRPNDDKPTDTPDLKPSTKAKISETDKCNCCTAVMALVVLILLLLLGIRGMLEVKLL